VGEREINCIFAVDLFNEGLDLPQVNTVLLLRLTQSATIFLQQLGRGLRRAEGSTARWKRVRTFSTARESSGAHRLPLTRSLSR
jgi:superfamily II DNA or RNA helicase